MIPEGELTAIRMEQASAGETELDEAVFLSGRPPFEEYLGFVMYQTDGGQSVDRRQLAEQWRKANKRIQHLSTEEAGVADEAPVTPLPSALEPLGIQVSQDPMFQRSFEVLPTTIAMIPLDRLVVFQKFINLTHVARIADQLKDASQEDVFRIALPLDHQSPPVRRLRTGNGWVFSSPSNDLRFLDASILEAGEVPGYRPYGPVAGIVALAIGYSANYLNVQRVGNRLILNNGSHRAYALREAGHDSVPAVVQQVSSRDELGVGPDDVKQRPDLYIDNPRPPMLRDYFDPALRTLVRLPRRNRQVQVVFNQAALDVPAG